MKQQHESIPEGSHQQIMLTLSPVLFLNLQDLEEPNR
jgi:hypothetical protein